MYLQQKHFKNFILDQKIPILITLTFFLITSYVAGFHHDYWVIDHDGQIYLHAGEQILAGNGKNVKLYNIPIGGPVIYASLNLLFDDGFNLLKSISVLGASGAVFFSYFIFKNIFNRKIALVGQLFFAFNPWLGYFAIQAENELLPIFLIAISFYYITKKELKLRDIVITGIMLGIASTIRFQSIVVLITFITFLILQSRNIRQNFFYVGIILLIFLIILSPLIFYNYTTHESIFDNNAAFFMQHSYHYQYPEWNEQLMRIAQSDHSTIDAIHVDFDLFLKNYFYNLFYNFPDRIFNFGSDHINTSLINSVTFFGLIPIIGGFVYLCKIKANKDSLIIISSSAIASALVIFLIGDINVHFFAIIGIPLFLLGLFNIKNVQRNVLPLLILVPIFILIMSIGLLRSGEQFFIMWFSLAMLGGVFFADVLPQIFKKIQPRKIKSNSSKTTFLVIIIISMILLSNLGYGYVLLRATSSGEPFVSVEDEFAKLFQNTPIEKAGIEIKEIGDLLSKQPNIENSYVMVPHIHYAYYINAKSIFGIFDEGIPDDTFENYVTRKNWKDTEIFDSNVHSFPMDRQNIYHPKPDYLVYALNPAAGYQHEYLKDLADPNSEKIPSNFHVLYFSNNTSFTHVVYKINYENDG